MYTEQTGREGRGSSYGSQVVDPRHRLRGHVHVAARRHDCERRAAEDPSRPGVELHRSAMGDRRLLADPGRAAPDLGLARRPARAPAHLRDRDRRLLGRLAALRHRAVTVDAQYLPGRAGDRRRDDVRDLAGAARARLPRPRPRRRVRRLGGGHRGGGVDRAADRRRVDRRAELALDLPRQRPHRRAGARPDADPRRGVTRPARRPARHPRLHHLHRCARHRSVRVDRVEPQGLGQHPSSWGA